MQQMIMPSILNELKRYKTLTNEETTDLFKKYKTTKDPDIFLKLYHHNLRFVVFFVLKKYYSYSYCIEDLIQEGNKALIRAIELFDLKKNVKFACYASLWITCKVNAYIDVVENTIRLPYHKVVALKRYIKADPKEKDNHYEYLKNLRDHVNIENISENDPHMLYHEDHNMKIIRDMLSNALDSIPNKNHKKIIELYYFRGYTYQKIATKFNYSRERIRQIINKNLTILKTYLNEQGIHSTASIS